MKRMERPPARDNENVPPTPGQQARAAAIAAEIAAIAAAGFALPGTLADRMTRCGHPNCRCHADPPQLHGPYHQWTRKKNGRTATRILTDDQLADYGPWFDNHKRLRELITELEETQPRHRRERPPLEPLARPAWSTRGVRSRSRRQNRSSSLRIAWPTPA